MGCEICGRSSCCKSFHSLEEQNNFDDIANEAKDRMRETLSYRINRIKSDDILCDENDNEYVKLSEVIRIIDEY